MADQRIQLIITAQDRASRTLGKVSAQTSKLAGVTSSLKGAVLGLGAAYIGIKGLEFALKGTIGAAVRWESAFAGVKKTVDGTKEEMKALNKQLQIMATEIPGTAEELARIAELGGQLGVGISDMEKFVDTIAKISIATNLTLEDASTAFARFSNIMGTPLDQIDRMGSVVVQLGNNFATTEAEIASMALRVAGVGNVIGLTEADVLGLSTAMLSVGVRAEAGGSAISRSMIKIQEAVSEGGESMEMFAQVSGLSSEDFVKQWKTAPITVLLAFVDGLAKAQKEGGDLTAIIDLLGITEIRERDNLLRLAGAQDLTSRAVKTANEEWEKNNALQEEAAKRADTTSEQWKLLKENVAKLGRELGTVFIPILRQIISDMLEWIETIKIVFGALKNLFNFLKRNIKQAASGVAEDIRGGIGAVRGLGGSISTRLGFAHGGIVPGPIGSPVPAIVHGGERIIPAGRSGGAGIVINMQSPVFLDEFAASKFGDELVKILKNNLLL